MVIRWSLCWCVGLLAWGQTQIDSNRQIRNVVPYSLGGTSANSQVAARANVGTPELVATDFPGTDLGQMVNNAFASFGAGCGTVLIPPGSYTYSTSIVVPSFCTLRGAGREAAILIYNGPPATAAVDLGNNQHVVVEGFSVQSALTQTCPNDGYLRWNAAAGGANKWQCWDGTVFSAPVVHLAGVKFGVLDPAQTSSGIENVIRNVNVTGGDPGHQNLINFGFYINGCQQCSIRDSASLWNLDGFYFAISQPMLLSRVSAQRNKRSGIHYQANNLIQCNNCLLQSNAWYGHVNDPDKHGAGVLADGEYWTGIAQGFEMFDPYFEANTVDVRGAPAGSGTVASGTFSKFTSIRGVFGQTATKLTRCVMPDASVVTVGNPGTLYNGCATTGTISLAGGNSIYVTTDSEGVYPVQLWNRDFNGLGMIYKWHELGRPSDGRQGNALFLYDQLENTSLEMSTISEASAGGSAPSANIRFTGKKWTGVSTPFAFRVGAEAEDTGQLIVGTGNSLQPGSTTYLMKIREDGEIRLPHVNAKVTMGGSAAAGAVNFTTKAGTSQGATDLASWKSNDGSTTWTRIRSDGALQTQPNGTRPACDASTRFTLWTVAGGAGVADTAEMCDKDAADVYAWRSVSGGGAPYGPAGGALAGSYPNPTIRDHVNVLDCGAVGDGVTNDVAALRSCLSTAQSGRNRWYFPKGTWRIVMGDTTDANFTQLDTYTFAIFSVTNHRLEWFCDPNAVIHVEAKWIPQRGYSDISNLPSLQFVNFDASVSARQDVFFHDCRINWIPGTLGSVTAATNATPIRVTMNQPHIQTDRHWVTITGVLGNTAANGTFQILNSNSTQFDLYEAEQKLSNCTNATPIQCTSVDPHGYATGNTVSVADVAGNTAANGLWTITAVDSTNFTLNGSAGNGAYVSGGVANRAVAGNGAYTSGGTVTSQLYTEAFPSTTGQNNWLFVNGGLRDSVLKNLTIDGFPGVGLLSGYTDSDGFTVSYNLLDNLKITNYGGASNDSAWYFQGGTEYRGGIIRSTRAQSSHGVYFGINRPYVKITGVTFDGVGKNGINIFASGSGNPGGHTIISNNIFRKVKTGIFIQPQDEDAVENVVISNNDFWGASGNMGTGIIARLVANGTFSNNTIKNFQTGISCEGCKSVSINSNSGDSLHTFINVSDVAGVRSKDVEVTSNAAKNPTSNDQGVFLTRSDRVNVSDLNLSNYGSAGGISIQGDATDIRISKYFWQGSAPAFGAINESEGWTGTRLSIQDVTVSASSGGNGINITAGGEVHVSRVLLTGAGNPGFILSSSTGPCYVDHVVLPSTIAPTLGCAGTVLTDNVFPSSSGTYTGVVRAFHNHIGSRLDTGAAAYASTYTPNAGLYRVHRIGTLTGNITINAPTNSYDGAAIELWFTQDGTGGRTVAFDPAFKANWTPDTTAGKTNVITFRHNGANWVQVAASTGL